MFVRVIIDRLGFTNEEIDREREEPRILGGIGHSHVQKRSRSKEVFLRQILWVSSRTGYHFPT